MKSQLSLSNNISALSNSKNEYYDVTSDEIGNITSYDGLNYTWVGRQLKSVSSAEDSSVGATYSYNSDGQRIGKNIVLPDGETYDYDYYYNGDILAGYKLVITDEEGQASTHIVTFMYDENGEAFGFNYNGNDYYYVRNAQNDVIFISNSDNTGVVMYQYDAWGNMTACYDTSDDGMLSIVNPYTYRGYFYEFETNTYFLKSRYYNPELCRFISADSAVAQIGNVQVANMFAYSANNPVNLSDSDGDWPKLSTVCSVIAASALIVSVTALCVATAGVAAVAIAGGGSVLAVSSAAVSSCGIAYVSAKVACVAASAAIASKAYESMPRNHTVYKLTDPNDGNKVKYVGRTKNVSNRKQAHKRDSSKSGLNFIEIRSDLNYFEARGLEQIAMLEYNTKEYLNRINGISPKNKMLGVYMEAGRQFSTYVENQISNEILYWTGN